jgi:hypothetical protein
MASGGVPTTLILAMAALTADPADLMTGLSQQNEAAAAAVAAGSEGLEPEPLALSIDAGTLELLIETLQAKLAPLEGFDMEKYDLASVTGTQCEGEERLRAATAYRDGQRAVLQEAIAEIQSLVR